MTSKWERRKKLLAPQYGVSGPAWTIDGTSGLGTPLTEVEAESVLADAGVASPNVTNLYIFGDAASGAVIDEVGSLDLTVSGTIGRQQAVTGWDLDAMTTTAGATGKAINTGFGNVNANSYVVFLLAFLNSSQTGGAKTIMRFGDAFDDDAAVNLTGTPAAQVGEGDGTYSSGSSDPLDAAHWFVLRIDDSANTVDLFTDQDKIIGGTQACNGTELCFGGDNVQTWLPPGAGYMLAFVHSGTMSNTEIKSALESLGYSPGWDP